MIYYLLSLILLILTAVIGIISSDHKLFSKLSNGKRKIMIRGWYIFICYFIFIVVTIYQLYFQNKTQTRNKMIYRAHVDSIIHASDSIVNVHSDSISEVYIKALLNYGLVLQDSIKKITSVINARGNLEPVFTLLPLTGSPERGIMFIKHKENKYDFQVTYGCLMAPGKFPDIYYSILIISPNRMIPLGKSRLVPINKDLPTDIWTKQIFTVTTNSKIDSIYLWIRGEVYDQTHSIKDNVDIVAANTLDNKNYKIIWGSDKKRIKEILK